MAPSSSLSPSTSTLTAARRRLFSSTPTTSSTVVSETSTPSNRIPAGVALLTVDRAAQLNALSSQVMRDLTAAAAAADADPRVRAIVVAGSGDRAFAAGADVKELAGVTHDEVERKKGVGGGREQRDGERGERERDRTKKKTHPFFNPASLSFSHTSPQPPPRPSTPATTTTTKKKAKKSRLLADWDRLSRVRVPLVAAVRGLALGGGFEVALMCDLIVAGDDARFALPEVNGLGVIPGMGATQRLPRAIGKYRAMEMVLLGRAMSATEAREAGLVARVVSPAEQTVAAALDLAGEIAASPPLAVAAAKRAVSHALETGSLSSGLEAEHAEFWACFGTAEQREGMSAFLEKREAKWPTII